MEKVKCRTNEKVRCRTTKCDEGIYWKHLTKDKEYLVIEEDLYNYSYYIKDDSGDECWFPILNFKTTQEIRDLKLKRLGI